MSQVTAFLVVSASIGGQALEALLERSENVRVVGSATPVAARREAAATADVVIVDASVPDGLLAVRRLAEAGAPQPTVIAVGDRNQVMLAECVRAGAGYIARSSTTRHLLATLEAAIQGDYVCSPGTARALREQSGDPAELPSLDSLLTRREKQVVELVAEGLTDKEIGAHLHIARSTVKKHVRNICGKLDVHRRTEVAAVLRRRERGAHGNVLPFSVQIGPKGPLA